MTAMSAHTKASPGKESLELPFLRSHPRKHLDVFRDSRHAYCHIFIGLDREVSQLCEIHRPGSNVCREWFVVKAREHGGEGGDPSLVVVGRLAGNLWRLMCPAPYCGFVPRVKYRI